MSAKTVKIPDKLKIHKICVLAWGMVGDTLFRTAFIEPLQKHYPQASISVIVDNRGKGIFTNNPHVDEIYVFQHAKRPKWRYLLTISKLIGWMRKRKFDLVINFYSGGSSPIITKLSGATWRVGFDHTAKLRWANNILAPKASFAGHWIRALGETLRPLGIQESDIQHRPFFYCSEAEQSFAKGFMAGDQKWVAFNLGASDLKKCWPVREHVALAHWLYQEYNLTPLIVTNPGQEFLVEEFKQHYPGNQPAKYLPVMSFGQIAAIVQCCEFLVTGDTGLMHLAFGVQARVLGLFTYTQPEHVMPEGGICVPCFTPDPSLKDEYGQALGTQPTLETVKQAAKLLLSSFSTLAQ
ncbi:MAG: glycosyltransferase family 9 protein [Gammaproteobacteria bacterium]|nr:glycosyltransferase family 9 protein [Gammaproteobacteria bacterium]